MLVRAQAPVELRAKLFRGMGDVSRLSILEALREGPRNVTEVVERTGLNQSNASLHLDCLWCCGLVDREVVGRYRYYRLKTPKILRLLRAAQDLLEDVKDRVDECSRYEDRKSKA